MLNKAIYLLTEYKSLEKPIDKDTIEQIILNDYKLKLSIENK